MVFGATMSDEREIVEITTEEFYCDGGDEFNHPRVIILWSMVRSVCNYCNIKYVLVKK